MWGSVMDQGKLFCFNSDLILKNMYDMVSAPDKKGQLG